MSQQSSGQPEAPTESLSATEHAQEKPMTLSNPDENTDMDGRKARRYEFMCLGTLGWALFVAGWGDGSNGPLIPRMQSYYHVSRCMKLHLDSPVHALQVNYTIVSLIFVSNCVVCPSSLISCLH